MKGVTVRFSNTESIIGRLPSSASGMKRNTSIYMAYFVIMGASNKSRVWKVLAEVYLKPFQN